MHHVYISRTPSFVLQCPTCVAVYCSASRIYSNDSIFCVAVSHMCCSVLQYMTYIFQSLILVCRFFFQERDPKWACPRHIPPLQQVFVCGIGVLQCVAVCCSVLQCAAVCCVCCNSVPSTFPIPDRRGRMYVCLYVWMYSYGQIIFWHLHFWKQAETLVSKLQRMKHSKLSCFCWHICCFRRNICCFGRFLNWFRLFLPAFKIGGVWRFVAVWCSVVQRVAVCCSVLQCVQIGEV